MAVRRSAPMDIRSGIAETARALGMDPVDLATIISYESGFNPDVWGGKGGQHYGLIQFGPTERQQYGVTVGDPSSQLGANGAIARYFFDRGWKPGMSLLDAYSIVNAGGPGLYNRSDAAAGGQPGTVRDKVEQQMGGHRQKALALLGEGSEQGPYDPRLDTPSSGRPVGSELPGPPANQYGLTVSHPPNPATGTGGYGRGTATPATTTDKKKQPWWKRMGEAMAEAGAATNFGEASKPAVPAGSVPAAAVAQMAPFAPVSAEQEDLKRQQLAAALARLNQGTLWG